MTTQTLNAPGPVTRDERADMAPILIFEAHPAAEHFPLLSEAEFAELKADIAKNGLLEPLWLYEGKILDGRNRYRACIELGIEPSAREYHGTSPVETAWSLNGQRRHLTPSQKAAVAVEMLPALQEEARRRQEASRALPGEQVGHKAVPAPEQPKNGRAVEHAAAIVGIGKTNVHTAKKIKERDPEAFEEIKRGEATVGEVKRRHELNPPLPVNPPAKQPREKRIADILQLASEGHRSEQIAEKLRIGVVHVRSIARDSGITLPDASFARSARIKVDRVIEETITNIEGCALGLQTIEDALSAITPEQAKQWAESMTAPLKSLAQLRKKLLEIAR